MIVRAKLTVIHAASLAVRAAVVVLDDDPQFYEGTPRNCLASIAGRDKPSPYPSFLGINTNPHAAIRRKLPKDQEESNSNPRVHAIKLATWLPLATLTPNLLRLPQQASLGRALGSSIGKKLASAALYTAQATSLAFVRADGSEEAHSLNTAEHITVHLRYSFACEVPLVSAIMCNSSLPNALRSSVAASLPGMRTLQLDARATLPSQSAPYRYASEQTGDERPCR